MPTYGSKVTTPTQFDRTGPNNNNQKASVPPGAATVPGRVVRLGGWVEQVSRDSRIAFAIWNVDANGRPTTLVARTDRFEPPNAGNGRVVTYPVRNPVSIGVGRRLAFGWMVSAGDVRIGRGSGTSAVYRRDADEVRDWGANPTLDPATVAFGVFAEAEDVPSEPAPGPVPPPQPPPPDTTPDPTPVDPLPPYVPPAVLPPYPTNLSPASGTTFASLERPLFAWDAFDPQGRALRCWLYLTEVGTGTTRSIELLPPATGTRWAYRATAELMPGPGLYEWWVEGRIFGTTLKPSPTERLLVTWAPPVSVAVGSPTENAAVATNAPAVSWTVTNGPQARWRARLYAGSDTAALRETGWVGSAETAWTVPLSWGLRNSRTYGLEVEVDGGGGASAVSPRRAFRVSYTPPANLTGKTIQNMALEYDSEASTPRLLWDETTLPVGQFGGYVVRRSTTKAGVTTPEVTVAHLTQRAQRFFYDTAAPVNEIINYRVTQLQVVSGVVTESADTEVSHQVKLTVPTLSSVYDGLSRRFAAMWLGEGLAGTFTRPETGVVTWGSGGRPTLISTPASYGTSRLSVSVTARTDATATLRQRAEALQALVESGDPVVWRGEWERIFCRVASWSWERGGVGQRTMNLELEEIAFDEGVDVIVTSGN